MKRQIDPAASHGCKCFEGLSVKCILCRRTQSWLLKRLSGGFHPFNYYTIILDFHDYMGTRSAEGGKYTVQSVHTHNNEQ